MAGVSVKLGGDMRPLLEAFATVKAQTRKLATDIKVAMAPVKTTFKALGSVAKVSFKGIVGSAKLAVATIKASFAGLRNIMPKFGTGTKIAGLLGIGAGVALLTSELKGAFDAAAAFEDLQVRVESFTGSQAAARDLLEELRAFADVTPFSSKAVQETAAQLLGAGVKDDVAQITKDLAAVAKDDQTLGELGDALAKGFAKGKFQTEELNKFLERGINLIPEFTAVTGLAGEELTKAIEKGLKFDQVTEAIARMSQEGGQFFGMLARQGMTFRGLWSTFSSGLDEIKKAFATPILMALKPILQDAIALTAQWQEGAAAVGKAIGDAALQVYALVKSGRTMDLVGAGIKVAFLGGVDVLKRGLRSGVAFLATALPPIFEAAVATLKDQRFWLGLEQVFRGLVYGIAGEVRAAIGDSEGAKQLRGASENAFTLSQRQIAMAGDDVSMTQVLADSLMKGIAAAAEQMKGPASDELRKALGEVGLLRESVQRELEGMRKKVEVPGPQKGATGAGVAAPNQGSIGAVAQQATMIASTLARIGGGGFGMAITPMVAEQRKGNQTLGKMEKHLARMAEREGGGAVFA